MRLEKQQLSLPVSNQDVESTSSFKRHGVLLGKDSKRALIVGTSGCGKTNAMLCLLLHPNGLRFENVYLCSKSLYQPKYQYLKQILDPIKEMSYFEYADSQDVPPSKDVKENSVFIFDDIACSNQDTMREYFSFGRHKNLDCFYLCQTYTKIPKQLIRDNVNFLILFKQDGNNLKFVFNEHVNGDMSYRQFQELCYECWRDKFGFLVIDKENELGHYRKGFDCFIYL